MDTKKNESTEEWLREVMILRNQYIFRCPDELRHDFETAVNGVILGKINGRDGNDEDHSSAPFRRFQFITEWNVKQYCETIENNGLKS